MLSDDAPIIGCVRAARGVLVVNGSRRTSCADCRAAIWVAPTGLALITQGAVAVCMECLLARAADDPDAEFVAPSAAQLTEIRRGFFRQC